MKNAGPTQIILAAGRSRRMGSPKPLLDFDGRTALDLVLEAGRSAGCTGSVAVVGHRGDEVRRAHEKVEDVTWVLNDDPESPQLRSLQLGLEALPPGVAFFVHPVDCPLVQAADYRLLIEALRDGERDVDVYYITHRARHGHPVLCRPQVAVKLLALGPHQTARDAIGKESFVEVHTANEAVLGNMNTPEEYEAMLELYRDRGRRSEYRNPE